jgi:hypothetical protein
MYVCVCNIYDAVFNLTALHFTVRPLYKDLELSVLPGVFFF